VSVDRPSENVTIWDGILDEGPKPDAGIEAVKTAVEARLAEFNHCVESLLDHLRTVSGNHRSFDQEKVRWRLTRLAQAYFLRQVRTPITARVAGLRKLAEALNRARDLAENARQDHIGSDLFSEWFDGPPRDPRGTVVRDDDGSLRVVYFPEIDFKQMVASLSDFQAAVLRAAEDMMVPLWPRSSHRRKIMAKQTSPRLILRMRSGPAASLPELFIGGLADAYQELTGRKPGTGTGPFYRFVMEFRAALDPSYKSKDEKGDWRVDESMIEAIKIALRRWRRAHGYSSK
jgi:hypothetical protein